MALTEEEIVEFRRRYSITDNITHIKVYHTTSTNIEHLSVDYLTNESSFGWQSMYNGKNEILLGVETIDDVVMNFPELLNVDDVWTEYLGEVL
mgnify:FL=1